MKLGDVRLAVSFSLDKEMDLYELASEFASQKRFSAWVKRYLQAELQRRNSLQVKSSITAKVGD
ncbi:MAG: hypothetical protein K6T83_21475 [Alicyclobacillus sp.]|nr:hypothetical protein [Alicyclobacillus sp.]